MDVMKYRPYERTILKSLLEEGIEPKEAEKLITKYYPVIYKRNFRGAINAEEYVPMLLDISRKGESLDDLKKDVYRCDPKEKRITRIFPVANLKLLIEYDNREYGVFDVKNYYKELSKPFYLITEDPVLLNAAAHIIDLTQDLSLFYSATLDKEKGVVIWDNGFMLKQVELYENSNKVVL
ncbi:hypothetical protein GE107_21450 [Cohnella sp. CFH 77786]|uniref:hypothetical protein n=1 Tax=Cohnella sp. CFH 77786 TaxID=2662265 RepID=UPI001C60D404|nr:hypothetical protein [Cohnella sp. CFH 77786]MBW5448616.1 hypothetical protein [Cohnella sp. CFH 77786]